MILSLNRSSFTMLTSQKCVSKLKSRFHSSLPSSETSFSTFIDTSSFSTGIDISDPPSITLYQYKICPFCNITKAFLNYTNVSFEQIEVNPLTKSELKSLQSKSRDESNNNKSYKKVPIAIIDNKQVYDSTEINKTLLKHPYIIHHLEMTKWNNHTNNNKMLLDQFSSSQEAMKWTQFANTELAPILYPNICKSLQESYDAFAYVKDVQTFTPMQKGLIRVIGSVAMYMAASRIKAKRNIENEREALIDTLTIFEKDGLQNGNNVYSSGLEQPNLGDLSMFGVMNSVSGLNVHEEIILGRDGLASEWYKRMYKEVYGNCIDFS